MMDFGKLDGAGQVYVYLSQILIYVNSDAVIAIFVSYLTTIWNSVIVT